MKRYSVFVRVNINQTYMIEAKSSQEAELTAEQRFTDECPFDFNYSMGSITVDSKLLNLKRFYILVTGIAFATSYKIKDLAIEYYCYPDLLNEVEVMEIANRWGFKEVHSVKVADSMDGSDSKLIYQKEVKNEKK